MKKKLFGTLVVFVIIITNVFSYANYIPTDKDEKILGNVYTTIDNLYKKNPQKVLDIIPKINKLLPKFQENERIFFILSKLAEHIESKETNNQKKSQKTDCQKTLGNIVKQHNKITEIVSNYDQLTKALNKAKSRDDKNKWFEIILEPGTYNMKNGLKVDTPKVIFRGKSGDKGDIKLYGNGMKSGISHIFWVLEDDVIIGDMTIGKVKNHAIQVHGEKDADNFFMHNVRIEDTGEQMLKGSYDSSKKEYGTDNGKVSCSEFVYTSGIGPQYYIGGIDVHNGKNWIISDNYFANIISPESSVAEHAIHFWSDSENTVVKNNYIKNCDRGIGFGLGDRGHKGGLITNNLIYHNSNKGDVGIGLENSDGTQVFNNTIFFENAYKNAIEYRFSGTNAVINNNLTNKLIKSRDGGKADVGNNIIYAEKDRFKSIENDDFSIVDKYDYVTSQGIGADILYKSVISNNESTNENNAEKNDDSNNFDSNNQETNIDNKDQAIQTYHNAELPSFEEDGNYLRDIYVDISKGNDSGDGSKGNPFKSIKNVASIVKPGDVIHIAGGTYPGSNYFTTFQGTKNNPIKIIGDKNSEVVFEGGKTGLQFVNGRYLIIRNITVKGSSDNGINIDDGGDYSTSAHHILLDNIKIMNIGNGGNQDNLKMSGVNDFWIINSSFKDGSSGGSGIDMVGCHRGVIENNRLENMGNNFVQIKGGSSNITIKNNFMKKVIHRGINMGGSTGEQYFRPSIQDGTNYEAKNINVTKNIFVDTNSGVAFVGCYKCSATKNIIYKPRTWAFRILQETVFKGGTQFIPSSEGVFSNNIIVFENSLKRFVNVGPSTDSESFEFEGNLWYCIDNPDFDFSSGKASLPSSEKNAIIQKNPQFVDEKNENFELKETSPMYDIFEDE